MAPKKNSKVNETEISTIVEKEAKSNKDVVLTDKLMKKDDVETPEPVEEKVTKPKKEVKSKKVVEQQPLTSDVICQVVKDSDNVPNIEDVSDQEYHIKQKLDNTKKEWLRISNDIQKCHSELEKLEIEQFKTVKELKELLDQLHIDDNKVKGFTIDNKVQLTSNTKNDIIPVNNDSDNDSDDESDNESDSDEKQTLLIKKSKSKVLIKTTKGNSKNIKLVNDSESESD